VADHLHVDEVTAPDLYGLVPDDAARACYEQDLAVAVDVADMVEVRGWDPARVRVTAQWPSPGSRMDGTTVVVLVDIVDGGTTPVSESLDGTLRGCAHLESHPRTSQRAAATAASSPSRPCRTT
jgi:hypothetical protein